MGLKCFLERYTVRTLSPISKIQPWLFLQPAEHIDKPIAQNLDARGNALLDRGNEHGF